MKKIILSGLISFFLLSGLKNFAQVFISFDGIKGESTFKAFPGSTEIEGFEWGAKNPVTMSGATGGASAGKVQVNELIITKLRSTVSPTLQMNVFTGKRIMKAEIRLYKPGPKEPVLYLTITLEDVLITNWSISANGHDMPAESISLVFARFKTEDGIQRTDGTIEKLPPVGWDILKNIAF
jgi:type VI secretion system secreted protein Hcp